MEKPLKPTAVDTILSIDIRRDFVLLDALCEGNSKFDASES